MLTSGWSQLRAVCSIPLADDRMPVVTDTAPEEAGGTANDYPCRASFSPDTIATDLTGFENHRLVLADALAARVALRFGLSGKSILCLNSRLRNT